MYILERTRALLVSSRATSSVECLLHSTTHSQITIDELSDKVLLGVFRYFLDASPRHWIRLVHICHKWRRIVFEAQRPLSLRLFCTHGTPVLKNLDCWPALPIVVEYGGSPPLTAKDENNIVAALKRSERVHSITLTITSSLLKKLSTLEGPFSELEDLNLRSRHTMQLTSPSTFRWGSRLRCLHLSGIAFPTLLRLLSSSNNLVELRLHDVLQIIYFLPETLAKFLAGMPQLRSFSLHFPSSPTYSALPPPSERFVLPALTHLDFLGTIQYLENLTAIIDAPRLEGIEITPIDYPDTRYPKFCEFVNRIQIHKSHSQAHILFSKGSISISLTQPGSPAYLRLQSPINQIHEQLFYIAQICVDFSSFLSNVRALLISSTQPKWDGVVTESWGQVFNPFSGVTWLHLGATHLNIVMSALFFLELESKHVLPALHKLYISQARRHAPLTHTVVSFITSRRLSGHYIAVEFEQSGEICGTGPFSQQVTIAMFSEDILLNVFGQLLADTPHIWPVLVWVCRRWRQVVFASTLGLNLRLYCTHGTPVLKSLYCWPALPFIVQYGGVPNIDPPAPEDDDNIIAAMKQSGRVSSISLTVTSSLLEKLSTISEPLSELEELVLLSQDNVQRTLPSTFLWGPRLRTLHTTGVSFPSLPPLLLPCQDLVDLHLHEIPSSGFPPEAFTNALFGTPQLRSLTLHLLSFPRRRSLLSLPPLEGGRVVLPALICFRYRGTSKYLDSLVARIDAPHLGDLDITLFNQPTMDARQLGCFIERIEMHTSFSHAEVENSADAISVAFTDSSASTRLRLQVSCKQLDWQLSAMAQVCHSFSPFLFRISDLGTNMTKLSSGNDAVDGEQWRELVRSFSGTRDVSVAGEAATDILFALSPGDGGATNNPTVLPILQNIHVRVPESIDEQFRDAALPFITSRRLSGRPVELRFLCHICVTSFTRQQELKTHLVDKHAYRIMCSYCGDFEHKRRYQERHDHFLFRDHLEGKHPEVARNDELFSNPFSTLSLPSELEALVSRHSSLRAPIITADTEPDPWGYIQGP